MATTNYGNPLYAAGSQTDPNVPVNGDAERGDGQGEETIEYAEVNMALLAKKRTEQLNTGNGDEGEQGQLTYADLAFA